MQHVQAAAGEHSVVREQQGPGPRGQGEQRDGGGTDLIGAHRAGHGEHVGDAGAEEEDPERDSYGLGETRGAPDGTEEQEGPEEQAAESEEHGRRTGTAERTHHEP